MPRMFDGRNAARDIDQAESDYEILLDFYSRLGSVTRPYLLTAIKQERHRIPDYTWGRVALGFMRGFTESGTPSSRFEGAGKRKTVAPANLARLGDFRCMPGWR